MAVFTSKRLPACSPPRKIPNRTHAPVILHLRFLSLPLPGRRLVVISSSTSPSPLLEESPDELAGRSPKPTPSPPEAAPVEHQDARFRPGRPSSQPPGGRPEAGISNGFIQGLAERPDMAALAYEYYQKARAQPGFRPDKQTLRPLIKYLLKCRQWDAIAALSEDFRAYDVLPDRAACDRLIRGCIRARKFRLTESLLSIFLGAGAAWAFGSAMRGYNKLHMYSSTLQAHEQMRAAGVLPDARCYFWVMDAHRKLGNTEAVLALFREFESRQMRSTTPAALSSRIYFAVSDALGRSGRAFEALRYFREMTQKGIPPDAAAYSSLITSFAGVKEAEIAEDLFQEGREKGLVRDPAVFLRLVLMYVEVGAVGKTLEVARAMKELGLGVSDCVFCAVINGHARKAGLRAATGAYEELTAGLGCEPGQVSYASAIGVFCRLGLYPRAEALFQEMLGKGFDRCVVAYANMVSMYGKCGRTREATRLVARMKEKGCEPNVWVYNALIEMHGRAMELRRVEKVWKEMRRRRVAPDRVSYTSAIGAYGRAGELGECARLYEEFRAGGGELDRAVAGIMVGVFSRSGRAEELVRLLRDVEAEGVEVDERLYMSALNALRDAGLQAQTRWFQESFGSSIPRPQG